MTGSTPQIGQFLRDRQNNGKRLFKVTDVFPANGDPGMILEWNDEDRGTRGQAFTTRDWKKRWEVIGPVKRLECCCCGSTEIHGRQWWNRDTGYGICLDCIAYVRNHGETEAEIRDNYGVLGIHWGLEVTA